MTKRRRPPELITDLAEAVTIAGDACNAKHHGALGPRSRHRNGAPTTLA